MPVAIGSADLTEFLPADQRVLVGASSAESMLLGGAVLNAGERVGRAVFTGIFVPGLNRQTYLAGSRSRVETFFMTPELRSVADRVELLPLCYRDILDRLQKVDLGAALMMVTPPDADGLCSFGPAVDFLAHVWARAPIRVAHINPLMPRTHGAMSIPFDQITAYVEADQPLLEMASGDPDLVTDAIAESVGRFIGDGATLQIGLGKIPGAVLRTLRARRNLRIHSGLIGDAVVDLEEAGALADGISVTAGVAIGTKRLYRAIQSEKYIFKPVAQTHDPHVMASLSNLVTINSALAVDLFGQCYAERANGAFVSGPGGASEFAAGAKLAQGLRIIALPASAGGESRIVLRGEGPVSLSRMDTDIVVTEHGFADLRGLGHEGRAAALISLAPPDRRAELRASWEKMMRAAL